MKLPKISKTVAYGLVIFALILAVTLYMNPLNLSITETSCTGDKIWIKYSLADDDAKLASLIPDCASNPAGGWVGEVNFYTDTPLHVTDPTAGRIFMGGYTATKDSSQKISCGSGQGGKEFAGATIPNAGLGAYFVVVKGTYYLASENYLTPHKFEYEQGKNINCVLPSSTCSDGSALRTCSAQYKGKYCTASAVLIDRANYCGCPEGMVSSGAYCKLPPAPEADEPEAELSPVQYDPATDTEETAQATINAAAQQGGNLFSGTPTTTVLGVDYRLVIIGASLFAIAIAFFYILRRR